MLRVRLVAAITVAVLGLSVVPALADEPPITLVDTGLETAGELVVAGGFVGFAVPEDGSQDLNGDFDAWDTVFVAIDLETGEHRWSGLAVRSYVRSGKVFYLAVSEVDDGYIDHTGDGDSSDLVLFGFDPTVGYPTYLGEVAESDTDFDPQGLWQWRGGGGELAAAVLQSGIVVLNPVRARALPTGIETSVWSQDSFLVPVGDRMVFLRYRNDLEALTILGPTGIIGEIRPGFAPGSTRVPLVAGSGSFAHLATLGRHLLVTVFEGTNGDLNGDGDAEDRVYYVLDAGELSLTNLGVEVPAPSRASPVYAPRGGWFQFSASDQSLWLYNPFLDALVRSPFCCQVEYAGGKFAAGLGGEWPSTSTIFDPLTGESTVVDFEIGPSADPWFGGFVDTASGWSSVLMDPFGLEVLETGLVEAFVIGVWSDGRVVLRQPSLDGGAVVPSLVFFDVERRRAAEVPFAGEPFYPVAQFSALANEVWVLSGETVHLLHAPVRGGREVGLVDPVTGKWFLSNTQGVVSSFYYGNPGDVPFMGDWDCDGVDTPGMYRQSDGYVYLRNANSQGVADVTFLLGNPGDLPLIGDFDGDGCDTVSVYRPSESRVFVMNELGADGGGLGAAEFDFVFGNPGDAPFVGDFDGDGVDTVGLHRASTGLVYLRNSLTTGTADVEFFFGNPGDWFVAGDWTGDGVASPGVFRPGDTTMYFRFLNAAGVADATMVWGEADWLPVAGSFGLG